MQSVLFDFNCIIEFLAAFQFVAKMLTALSVMKIGIYKFQTTDICQECGLLLQKGAPTPCHFSTKLYGITS